MASNANMQWDIMLLACNDYAQKKSDFDVITNWITVKICYTADVWYNEVKFVPNLRHKFRLKFMKLLLFVLKLKRN